MKAWRTAAERMAVAAIAVLMVSQAVWAISSGNNTTVVNGAVNVVGPPSPTTLTTNGVLLGAGTSAITATTACTTANDVLLAGSPPSCGALTDNHVPDTITASNYLPLAGGTLTGQLVTDNLGIEYEESDTNPTCSSGNFNTYADLSENKLKKCVNGVTSDLAPAPAPPMTGGTNMGLTGTNTVVYTAPGGLIDPTEANAAVPFPAGTYGNLRVSATAAGVNSDTVVFVRTGTCGSALSNSTVTCTVTGSASHSTCSDTSNTIAVTEGQCVSVRVATDSADAPGAPQFATWSLERVG